MRLKNTNFASEYAFSTESQIYPSDFARSLLRHKIEGLARGLIIPDNLIAELEDYSYRNSLNRLVSDEKSRKVIKGCCPQCLKAHMIKKARESGISEQGTQFLSLFMQGEAGHNGYYLDGDALIKI